ncbi:Terpenoid synthase [Fusarium beomiforme]|uniref:Terpenoid synthase n=1 Tax=Fusarium beomiforme TaxID=44412 RepID=A0A9P5DTM2_9HYPO|nr:Terpenoid synthase [Fusarium beomiforme]
MASSDDQCEVPELLTRFTSRKHPQTAHIFQYSKLSCERSLKEVSKNEVISRNGEFAACGGLYASWVYPGGDAERIKVVADFYSAWVFLDDLIDNSIDMKYTCDVLDDIKARVAGSRQGNHGLDFLFRLWTHEGWNSELLQLGKAEIDLWLNCTQALRKIEVDQASVSVEEYLTYRQTNAAMGLMFLIMPFTRPDLTNDLLYLYQTSPETLKRIFSYSGRNMGVILDLYKLNADHAQITEYSHIAAIVQQNSDTRMDFQQAVNKSAEIFHEYEDKLVVEFNKVATLSPRLAKALEDVHAGSISWLNLMRGRRYVKKAEPRRRGHMRTIAFVITFFGLLLTAVIIMWLWPSLWRHYLAGDMKPLQADK